MTTSFNTAEVAEQVLDLEINRIEDGAMRLPYGSPNMNLLSTRTVMRLPYGSPNMNRLATRTVVRVPYGSPNMNRLATRTVLAV